MKDEYPTSVNDKKCLGPCEHPNSWIVHPITLKYQTNKHFPFCPTNAWKDEYGKTLTMDECTNPTVNKHINIITPKIEFTCDHFLKIYYKIYSFDNALTWLQNNTNTSYYTQSRILNCIIKTYKSHITKSDEFITYYIKFIKKYYIKDIYKSTNKYISIKDKKIKFKINSQNDRDHQDHKVTKINFIIQKMVTKNNINNFINEYIKKNKNNWGKIQYHNIELKKQLTTFLVNHIKNIIQV